MREIHRQRLTDRQQLAASSRAAHSSSSRRSQSVRLEHDTLESVAASCTYASAIKASKDILDHWILRMQTVWIKPCITIKCDHLPLRKFLKKQTLNSKVNNWVVELGQFNLKMEWIQGSKNTLADSLSCLLEVVPEAKLEKEPEGQEFSCYCFEDLMPVSTEYIEEIAEMKM